MVKILRISLKLNFTPSTLGCCGLNEWNFRHGYYHIHCMDTSTREGVRVSVLRALNFYHNNIRSTIALTLSWPVSSLELTLFLCSSRERSLCSSSLDLDSQSSIPLCVASMAAFSRSTWACNAWFSKTLRSKSSWRRTSWSLLHPSLRAFWNSSRNHINLLGQNYLISFYPVLTYGFSKDST